MVQMSTPCWPTERIRIGSVPFVEIVVRFPLFSFDIDRLAHAVVLSLVLQANVQHVESKQDFDSTWKISR